MNYQIACSYEISGKTLEVQNGEETEQTNLAANFTDVQIQNGAAKTNQKH